MFRPRFRIALHLIERHAQLVMIIRVPRLQLHRPLMFRPRFLIALHLVKSCAQLIMILRVLRLLRSQLPQQPFRLPIVAAIMGQHRLPIPSVPAPGILVAAEALHRLAQLLDLPDPVRVWLIRPRTPSLRRAALGLRPLRTLRSQGKGLVHLLVDAPIVRLQRLLLSVQRRPGRRLERFAQQEKKHVKVAVLHHVAPRGVHKAFRVRA